MPDGRHWTVESDGSVTDPSAEVVSPVCRWEDIEMVQKVVRALRNAGAKVDESCGIHIHVGLGSHTPKTLRNLVNIVNAKEDLLTMALGITPERRGRWCKPVEPLFLQKLNSIKPKTMEDFARVWYTYSDGSYSDWRRCALRHWGITVEHVCATTTYEEVFYKKFQSGKRAGQTIGFPHTMGAWCNSRLKVQALNEAKKLTYEDVFYQRFGQGKREGEIYGFPFLRGPWCNSKLKRDVLRAAERERRTNACLVCWHCQ